MENISNQVTLSGYVGSDAEIKNLVGNKKLVKVNLAVNEYYKNASGEDVKNTQWFNLTFWGKEAEAAADIKKGNFLSVLGRLQNNSYETKDGQKRYNTSIVVNSFTIKSLETAV